MLTKDIKRACGRIIYKDRESMAIKVQEAICSNIHPTLFTYTSCHSQKENLQLCIKLYNKSVKRSYHVHVGILYPVDD